MGKLYIVPTPIGNLEDITIRAIHVLKEVDFIFAEDTRTSKKLLDHYEIKNQLVAYHIHNEHKTLERNIDKIKQANAVALISDAGTPAVSDPGFLLIRACHEEGIPVTCLPGPNAIIPAIVGSGIPCDRFIFEGFLPHKKGRLSKWESLKEEKRTIALYESPHRIMKCLGEIQEHFGEQREVAIAREISKLHEEFLRAPVVELIEHFKTHPPRGEFVVIISPPNKQEK